jgi:hypothetical protein
MQSLVWSRFTIFFLYMNKHILLLKGTVLFSRYVVLIFENNVNSMKLIFL